MERYTEELYKKDLNEPDNHDGVVSHPEPDVLESEVKWALGSTAVNKASRCDGIRVELFKTLKDDAIKVLHSVCQQIWKTQQWPQDWKRSIFTLIPKKDSTKECASIGQSHSSPMLVRSCLKSCMLGFSIMQIKNFQNRKVAFIENGTWAPMAGKKMREAMSALKNIEIIEPLVTVESTVKPETVEALKVLAAKLIEG